MNGMDEWQRKMNEASQNGPHPNSLAAKEARIEALEAALRAAVHDLDEIRRQAGNSLTRIAKHSEGLEPRAALDPEQVEARIVPQIIEALYQQDCAIQARHHAKLTEIATHAWRTFAGRAALDKDAGK